MTQKVTSQRRKLWEHPNPTGTKMHRFLTHLNRTGTDTSSPPLHTFADLAAYSVTHRNDFYVHLFYFLGLLYQGSVTIAVDETLRIDQVPKWFPGVRVNFAENMLYSSGKTSTDAPSTDSANRTTSGKEDGKTAVISVREGGDIKEWVTWGELRRRTGELAGIFRERGFQKGERVLVVGGNCVETLVVYLATEWLGGVFSSVGTDMGAGAVVQRARLIDPKYIFYDDSAVYNGKTIDLRPHIEAVIKGVVGQETNPSFLGVIVTPRFVVPYDTSHMQYTTPLSYFRAIYSEPPLFTPCDFHEPSVVYYSSGTTGVPKAIVHTVGGIILNGMKECMLHEYRDERSISLQYSTTGWIMYLSAVSPLMVGATVVLYDGSPLYPSPKTFLQLTGELSVTKLGMGPRFFRGLENNGIVPHQVADLQALEIVTSTGMILSDDQFEWFYGPQGFPRHVHLANLSGGTDIAGCFGLENPLTPVYVGGTQGISLGVDVAIFNSSLPFGAKSTRSHESRQIIDGSPGELVAPKAFPNIPCFLWDDGDINHRTGYPWESPGPKYRKSYFDRYPGVWAHGDLCRIDPVTGNIIFLGRADGVLNPSGIRFGSADIYNVIEKTFSTQIADSLCVGRRRPHDTDEKVMLFLVMRPGHVFSDALARDVRREIARQLSKRHIPAFVFAVPEVPVTANGKKVEVLVKKVISGEMEVDGRALGNPGVLKGFERFVGVEEEVKGKL